MGEPPEEIVWSGTMRAANVLAATLLDEGLCGEVTDELATGYVGVGSRAP